MKNLMTVNQIRFLIPICLFIGLVILSRYTFSIEADLSLGLTLDFVFTIPLVYYFIIRHTEIPKVTVVPVFTLGMLSAYYLLSVDQHYYLDLVKKWVLPFVELSVLGFFLYKIHQIRKGFGEQKNNDFYTQMLFVVEGLFPEKIGRLLATELAVCYYGFGVWTQKKLSEGEFSYHKKSGTPALLWLLLLVMIIELFSIHLLLGLWNPTIAWIASILSFYTILQVVAFIKSLSRRPIEITDKKLNLKYGIHGDASIDLDAIQKIVLLEYNESAKDALQFSFLGNLEKTNVLIELKRETKVHVAFGRKELTAKIMLFVDEKQKFKQRVEALIK